MYLPEIIQGRFGINDVNVMILHALLEWVVVCEDPKSQPGPGTAKQELR